MNKVIKTTEFENMKSKSGATRSKFGIRFKPNHIVVAEIPESMSFELTLQSFAEFRSHPAVVGAHVGFEPLPEPEPPKYPRRVS